jgi:hypothetical protein
MSQSSPEGIILGKGSKLISFNAKINDEVVVSIEEKTQSWDYYEVLKMIEYAVHESRMQDDKTEEYIVNDTISEFINK